MRQNGQAKSPLRFQRILEWSKCGLESEGLHPQVQLNWLHTRKVVRRSARAKRRSLRPSRKQQAALQEQEQRQRQRQSQTLRQQLTLSLTLRQSQQLRQSGRR